jgi:hypothetical protein
MLQKRQKVLAMAPSTRDPKRTYVSQVCFVGVIAPAKLRIQTASAGHHHALDQSSRTTTADAINHSIALVRKNCRVSIFIWVKETFA